MRARYKERFSARRAQCTTESIRKTWMVSKKIYAELPPKVEYKLTAFGRTVLPLVSSLGEWGDRHKERLRRSITEASGDRNVAWAGDEALRPRANGGC